MKKAVLLFVIIFSVLLFASCDTKSEPPVGVLKLKVKVLSQGTVAAINLYSQQRFDVYEAGDTILVQQLHGTPLWRIVDIKTIKSVKAVIIKKIKIERKKRQ